MFVQATISRNFLTEYYSGDQVKEHEMGGACGNYGESTQSEMVKRGEWRPL
jgi:hypothetical protein